MSNFFAFAFFGSSLIGLTSNGLPRLALPGLFAIPVKKAGTGCGMIMIGCDVYYGDSYESFELRVFMLSASSTLKDGDDEFMSAD